MMTIRQFDQCSTMKYHINVWNGEDGYLIAKCVELPAAMTQGKTRQEIVENMKEAIALVLQDIQAEVLEKDAQLLTVEA
jgi:predicted RNase H-like HicB family nuclease